MVTVVGEVWELVGDSHQNGTVMEALMQCDYPFERLREGLRRVGRETIPVEWVDLTSWGAGMLVMDKEGDAHVHNHESWEYDMLAARGRVLGLAWYAGKVSLDLTLMGNKALAMEVFLSEGAHMVDFFDPEFTDEVRQAIFNLYHTGDPAVAPAEHGHGWFDVGTYREFVGEAFMGGFIRAFAPGIPVTIPFAHETTPTVASGIRRLLVEDPLPKVAVFRFPSGRWRGVYHTPEHARKINRQGGGDPVEVTRDQAEERGTRPCLVCDPLD